MAHEIATLGGGCFWCLEAVYREAEGVSSAVSGYMGGASPNPSYKEVCSGRSGHVEVVQVTFDPAAISYRDVLEIFFAIHDPTTLSRQGNDAGTQYRSVIFYHSPEQKATAEEVIRELTAEKAFDDPIVTAVEPRRRFTRRGLSPAVFRKQSISAVLRIRGRPQGAEIPPEIRRSA